jgi:hypothetical protein
MKRFYWTQPIFIFTHPTRHICQSADGKFSPESTIFVLDERTLKSGEDFQVAFEVCMQTCLPVYIERFNGALKDGLTTAIHP